jgi:hypothetical protein
MPRGGARVGSGRKPKTAAAHIFAGTARGSHKEAAKAPALPAEFVHEPASLSREGAEVWRGLAPYAMAARTLTAATAEDMRELCEMVVEMRAVLVERRKEGWSDQGMRLAKEYRGLVQRVEAKMRGFRLSPVGKEMAEAAPKVVDPWAEFDGEAH